MNCTGVGRLQIGVEARLFSTLVSGPILAVEQEVEAGGLVCIREKQRVPLRPGLPRITC